MWSASIGVWDWDLHTNTTVWDDTIFAIFGNPKMVPMAYEKLRNAFTLRCAQGTSFSGKGHRGKAQDSRNSASPALTVSCLISISVRSGAGRTWQCGPRSGTAIDITSASRWEPISRPIECNWWLPRVFRTGHDGRRRGP